MKKASQRGTAEIHDFNGPGPWSLDGVQERYARCASDLRLSRVTPLEVRRVREGSAEWVYPVMEAVIDGIERGDHACIELGVEFIESDHQQPFGRILKSNTARALRRASLTPDQVRRVRRRVYAMLAAGHVPREFREYAKLLRSVGLGKEWPHVVEQADRSNRFIARYLNYFEQCAREASRDPVRRWVCSN